MNNWGVIVAAVILTGAIVFYGLSGRYMVVDNANNTKSFKVDRLTGHIEVISNSSESRQYMEFELKQH